MSMPKEHQERQKIQHLEVSADRDGQRLDNFLFRHLKGVPKNAVYRLIRTGQVRVNGGRAKPERRVVEGDVVRIPPANYDDSRTRVPSDSACRRIEAAIIHEDDDVIVVDKPSGIAVHAGSGLPWGLIDAVRQIRPGKTPELVHRLDRDTSGVLVLACSREALDALSSQFRGGEVSKRYLCLLDGVMSRDVVDVDQPLASTRKGGEKYMQPDDEGSPARSRFERLEQFKEGCYAAVTLETGRTHQIRAHARYLGHPLAGDTRYGRRDRQAFWKQVGLKRLFLHAAEIAYELPGGRRQHHSAPLPDDLRDCLDRIREI
jgi:23S rRNA pseudouridine955/2504/2580 synthase